MFLHFYFDVLTQTSHHLSSAGEEALLPLCAGPINVSFKCTLEAIGPYGTPWAVAKFTGGSFMRPGEVWSWSSVDRWSENYLQMIESTYHALLSTLFLKHADVSD